MHISPLEKEFYQGWRNDSSKRIEHYHIPMKQIKVYLSIIVLFLSVSSWARSNCEQSLGGGFEQQIIELKRGLLVYAAQHRLGNEVAEESYIVTLNNPKIGAIFITQNHTPVAGSIFEQYLKLEGIDYEEQRYFGVTAWFIKPGQFL